MNSNLLKYHPSSRQHYDAIVIGMLEEIGPALSLEAMHLLTGIRKDRLCKVIKSMQKFGQIRIATEKKIKFYQRV